MPARAEPVLDRTAAPHVESLRESQGWACWATHITGFAISTVSDARFRRPHFFRRSSQVSNTSAPPDSAAATCNASAVLRPRCSNAAAQCKHGRSQHQHGVARGLQMHSWQLDPSHPSPWAPGLLSPQAPSRGTCGGGVRDPRQDENRGPGCYVKSHLVATGLDCLQFLVEVAFDQICGMCSGLRSMTRRFQPNEAAPRQKSFRPQS